jgi:hypothetical protein
MLLAILYRKGFYLESLWVISNPCVNLGKEGTISLIQDSHMMLHWLVYLNTFGDLAYLAHEIFGRVQIWTLLLNSF